MMFSRFKFTITKGINRENIYVFALALCYFLMFYFALKKLIYKEEDHPDPQTFPLVLRLRL